MTKLKTLNDLYSFCYECKKHKNSKMCTEVVIKEHLKQEAIKWIKSYKKWKYHKNIGQEIAVQFMLFLNITEEDLK